MTEKIVTLTVDTDGNPQIEVKGVKGPACLALTEDLENALGGVISRQKTAEYTAAPSTTAQTAKLGG